MSKKHNKWDQMSPQRGPTDSLFGNPDYHHSEETPEIHPTKVETKMKRVVGTSLLNVRAFPDISSALIQVIQMNETYEVISVSGEWTELKIPTSDPTVSLTGFALSKYLGDV